MAATRDLRLDYVRGFAALIVVVGHVMQQFEAYNDNILFNIIFSIQMPLFMMVSGYAVTYSTPIVDAKSLGRHLLKRLRALLLPWASFTILAFFFIDLSHHSFVEYLKYAAYHMESAFWFLFSLWTIDTMFSLSSFISLFFKRKREYIKVGCMLALGGVLLVVGHFMGLSFLGIKYSIYYTVFFLAGYILSKIKVDFKNNTICFIVCVFIFAYAILIHYFNIEDMPDQSYLVFVRIIISIIGCLIVFSFFDGIVERKNNLHTFVNYCSKRSLELYVCQCFVLPFIRVKAYNLNTIEGFFFFVFYSLVVIVLTCLLISIIDSNKYSKLILFGKIK